MNTSSCPDCQQQVIAIWPDGWLATSVWPQPIDRTRALQSMLDGRKVFTNRRGTFHRLTAQSIGSHYLKRTIGARVYYLEHECGTLAPIMPPAPRQARPSRPDKAPF